MQVNTGIVGWCGRTPFHVQLVCEGITRFLNPFSRNWRILKVLWLTCLASD